ncbi:MAG: four helix bundle protein [Flavobacteriaceae bacterium]
MSYKSLRAYELGFELAMLIYTESKSFPKEEIYSLTDQIRRSSRSVCANIAEAYGKRIYPKHFISKISDADCENSETQVWIEFAEACKYIQHTKCQKLKGKSQEIGRLLQYMINNPGKFGS